MPADITATGTWSALDNQNPSSQAPGAVTNEVIRVHRDAVEQKFMPRALDYRQYPNDVDGMQEVMQFAGLMAVGYGIPVSAALVRIRDIIEGFHNTEQLPERREFVP
jgi:hypothetical protein